MRHKCKECGNYKDVFNMIRIPRHRGIPVYKCVSCKDKNVPCYKTGAKKSWAFNNEIKWAWHT